MLHDLWHKLVLFWRFLFLQLDLYFLFYVYVYFLAILWNNFNVQFQFQFVFLEQFIEKWLQFMSHMYTSGARSRSTLIFLHSKFDWRVYQVKSPNELSVSNVFTCVFHLPYTVSVIHYVSITIDCLGSVLCVEFLYSKSFQYDEFVYIFYATIVQANCAYKGLVLHFEKISCL